MTIKELTKKNRSYRRFKQSVKVENSTLLELADIARYCGSAANMQPIRYILSNTEKTNNMIFSSLKWAGYLPEWEGPEEGEKPAAYIVLTTELKKSKYILCDAGIACQSILLGAVEKGLGGCIFGSIDREKVKADLNIHEDFEVLLIIALGKPIEQVEVIDAINDNIKYFRDDNKTHYVPKLKLSTLVANHDQFDL